ncbi:MAG: hypothetical protein J5744_07765 [Oscillospiraceae bacterium]|nr:hypothetical protein [Oscillospiraceae bacterium]
MSDSGRYLKVCLDCFREFRSNGKNAKYCPECKERRERERRQEFKSGRQTAEKIRPAAKSLEKMTIGQIVAEAEREGLTYGQYVGKMSFRKK